MVQIGQMNRLSIKGTQVYGIHLDGGDAGDVLLRDKSAHQKYRPGEQIDVFVYADRENRLIATTRQPAAMVGDFAYLKVVSTSAAGAFMKWGLESDLLVPRSEQQDNMREDKSYVVFIFLSEKTNRITASSKLEKFLDQQPATYTEGEQVDLLVYNRTDLGYSAVINNAHAGMIYENEIFQKITIGQRLPGYVKKIREDGKIDLRLQQTGFQRVDDIAQNILDTIIKNGGMVGVSDKSPPEEIYALFGVSKKAYKRAIGGLYKKRLITFENNGTKLV